MGTTYRQRPLGGEAQTVPAVPPAPSVRVGVFMDRLERRGVTFALVANELHVTVPLGALSEALVRVALGPYQPAVAPTQPTAPTQTTWAAA